MWATDSRSPTTANWACRAQPKPGREQHYASRCRVVRQPRRKCHSRWIRRVGVYCTLSDHSTIPLPLRLHRYYKISKASQVLRTINQWSLILRISRIPQIPDRCFLTESPSALNYIAKNQVSLDPMDLPGLTSSSLRVFLLVEINTATDGSMRTKI